MNGFTPICDENSKILILGSFPSVISRQNDFYYGNNRNRFWKIFSEYFEENIINIDDKIKLLKNNNIALWDIIESCEVKGSLDSNIKNIAFNNIFLLLKNHPKIKVIFCNGKLSYNLTLKYLKIHGLKIEIRYLPSTSPANVSFNKNIWFESLKEWLG